MFWGLRSVVLTCPSSDGATWILQGLRDGWWCSDAMTRREYQRQGVMTALFQIVIDKVPSLTQRVFR